VTVAARRNATGKPRPRARGSRRSGDENLG
jgi:hypothetical protein